MSNPVRILKCLDRHLNESAEVTLFGRSAIALGFPDSPAKFHSTQDVDGILPLSWLDASNPHEDFWHAVQETNTDLESDGLYLTHLFREVDVILRPDWILWRTPIKLDLNKLSVFRPATMDLILTKMARADADDMTDIQFLLGHEDCTVEDLQSAFRGARVPNVPEIQEIFQKAQAKVIALVHGR